jgi:pimeloyl-ACP methyl ester carboxylesterase
LRRSAPLVAGLSFLGAQRVWAAALTAHTRRRVLREDQALAYDPYLASVVGGGEPIVLVSPTAKSTLMYFEGFRSRWVAGMYGAWLRWLHEHLDVNVVAPLIGLHGLPFRQRNLDWDHMLDIRQASQLYDLYAAAQPSQHRVVVASSCAGSLCALALAAGRPVKDIVLLAPAAAGFGAPRRMKRHVRCLVDMHMSTFVIPLYYRTRTPKDVGNWDIHDDELRSLANTTIAGNREWNAAQFEQLIKASRWADEELVPRITGKRITVVWGERDNFMPPQSIDRLARRLRESGNEVDTLELPACGHMVLMDRHGDRVRSLLEERVTEPAVTSAIAGLAT